MLSVTYPIMMLKGKSRIKKRKEVSKVEEKIQQLPLSLVFKHQIPQKKKLVATTSMTTKSNRNTSHLISLPHPKQQQQPLLLGQHQQRLLTQPISQQVDRRLQMPLHIKQDTTQTRCHHIWLVAEVDLLATNRHHMRTLRSSRTIRHHNNTPSNSSSNYYFNNSNNNSS